MAILNKPNMNYGVWAEGGNIEIPSSEKVEQGWIIEKPLNETMNWLQNRQDRMLQYINQRGIPEWDLRTEYPSNAFVSRVGRIYKSLSQNIDSDPTLNPEMWEIAFVSYDEFATYVGKVDNIIDTDGYLYNYVRKYAPVMLAPAKGVAYNNPTGVSGMKFSGVVPEIITNGFTVAKFGGGTNPKDVVTHEQLALAIQNYKVGDIYITTANGDPSERLGYGTWERFGKGRTLVGFSDSISNGVPEWTKASGREHGEYKQTLNFPHNGWGVEGLEIKTSRAGVIVVGSGRQEINEALESLTQPINDLTVELDKTQPSVVVYFWKRIS
ncbi:Putative tail fiber [Psychrobacter phage D'Alembert]|nr:Putative tail fiber [Psychrobacter phage D'Alembert]